MGSIVWINGKKYLDHVIVQALADARGNKKDFEAIIADIDAKQEKRNFIANFIAAHDQELVGKRPDDYIRKREELAVQAEAEWAKKKEA